MSLMATPSRWRTSSPCSVADSGGAVYYHSPIQSEPLRPGCHGFGTYGNYVANEKLNVKTFTSQYQASRLIKLEWVQHRAGAHKLYPAACDLQDAAGHTLITAYSVERPDGNWSLMLINKDQSNPHQVRIAFDDASLKSFTGPITMITFGSDQYIWKSDAANGHPDPNEPRLRKRLRRGRSSLLFPKASVTILRAKTGS
jgi:hypothetical protein